MGSNSEVVKKRRTIKCQRERGEKFRFTTLFVFFSCSFSSTYFFFLWHAAGVFGFQNCIFSPSSASSLSFLLVIKNRAAISGENCERAPASFGAVMFFFLFSGSFLLFLCRSNYPFSSHITSGVSHSRPRQEARTNYPHYSSEV